MVYASSFLEVACLRSSRSCSWQSWTHVSLYLSKTPREAYFSFSCECYPTDFDNELELLSERFCLDLCTAMHFSTETIVWQSFLHLKMILFIWEMKIFKKVQEESSFLFRRNLSTTDDTILRRRTLCTERKTRTKHEQQSDVSEWWRATSNSGRS